MSCSAVRQQEAEKEFGELRPQQPYTAHRLNSYTLPANSTATRCPPPHRPTLPTGHTLPATHYRPTSLFLQAHIREASAECAPQYFYTCTRKQFERTIKTNLGTSTATQMQLNRINKLKQDIPLSPQQKQRLWNRTMHMKIYY